MRAVSLALRGLWWRRGASSVIGVVAVMCVAVSAAGPAYAAAAADAVVQSTVGDARTDSDGTGLSVSRRVESGRPDPDALRGDIRSAFRDVVDHGYYSPAVLSIQAAVHVVGIGGTAQVTSPLVYRDDVCAHIVVVAGSCLSDAKATVAGALVSEAAAQEQGWTVGVVLPFVDVRASKDSPPLTVRGVYRPVDPDGGYWFTGTHEYFGASSATDAVFVTHTLWDVAELEPGLTVTMYADLALVPLMVHESDLSGLADGVRRAAALLRAVPGSRGYRDVVTTSLPRVVEKARQAASSVAAPVSSVVTQLLALSLAVLFLLMVGSHESRGGEVALGKLRGLSSLAAVSHAVLEPILLVTAAVPVGIGFAAVVLHAAARSVVGREAVITIGATSWFAGAAAGAAGVLAGLLSGVAVLRRPVLAQWQRTERRPRRFGWIVEAVVVTLALAASLQLRGLDASQTNLGFLPSAAPALFALAFALVGVRLVPLVARAGFVPTRASRFVGSFVAVRQLARRQGGLRAFAIVAVAVALVVFGWCSHVVFQANRQARAVAEVGADRVVVLQSTPVGTDVAKIVDSLDPSGREATAVYQGTYVVGPDDTLATGGIDFDVPTSNTPPSMLVVDPDRFSKVASWTTQYNEARGLVDTLAPLSRTKPTFVAATGTTLRVSGTVSSSSNRPTILHAALTDATGRAVDVTLGAVATTPGRDGAAGSPAPYDLTGTITACNTGCLLRGFGVGGQTAAQAPLSIEIGITAVSVGSAGRSTSVIEKLASSSWGSSDDTVTTVVRLSDPTPGLRLRVSAPDAGFFGEAGFEVRVGVPDSVPGLLTPSQQSTILGANVNLDLGGEGQFAVTPTVVDLLPRSGDAGLLVTRDWLAAAEPEGYDAFSPNEVWLSASAPGDFPLRLAAAGLTVASVESVAVRSSALARQGPSFAVAALGFGGAAGAILAVAGAVATFVASARRRLYELAALRALGLRPRRIWLSVVAEQAVTAVAATAVGTAAGLLGARVALEVLPEFGDIPSFPPLVVDLPVGGSLLVAISVATAVVVVTGVLAVGLVRRADTSRLRDGQG